METFWKNFKKVKVGTKVRFLNSEILGRGPGPRQTHTLACMIKNYFLTYFDLKVEFFYVNLMLT